MADIFISYRRDDARADAGRLHDRLAQHFGADRVFMDVDDIAPGEDFEQCLHATLNTCGAVVVVIGKDWLGHSEAPERSRLADPSDFVQIEIRTALERGIPVLPVLVGGATMPLASQVPQVLAPLLKRQAVEVRHARFNDDVDQLVRALSDCVAADDPRVSRRTLIAAGLAAVVLGGGYAGYRWRGGGEMALRSEPALVSLEEARAMVVRRGFFHARWNTAATGPTAPLKQAVVAGQVVVRDRGTGLMWQHGGSRWPMTWAATGTAIAQLNQAAHAGFDDWRLPTLEEAVSLMRPEPRDHWYLDSAFDAAAAPFVWTFDRAGDESGWVVYYFDGICAPESVHFNASVRAVRTDS